LFKALSNPLRLRILVELMASPQCVHDLTTSTRASQPLVSQHLRVLRQAHLVTGDKAGRETVYSIADQHIAHIIQNALTHISEEKK
jgi:ArsR family transcriptional regulator